jgi:hypothetical protein
MTHDESRTLGAPKKQVNERAGVVGSMCAVIFNSKGCPLTHNEENGTRQLFRFSSSSLISLYCCDGSTDKNANVLATACLKI